MANNFMTIEMDDGSELLLQTVKLPGESDGTVQAADGKKARKKAKELMQKSAPQIAEFAEKLKDKVTESMLDNAPDEFELEFSVGFSVEGNAAIVSSEFSTGIVVHLKWDLNK